VRGRSVQAYMHMIRMLGYHVMLTVVRTVLYCIQLRARSRTVYTCAHGARRSAPQQPTRQSSWCWCISARSASCWTLHMATLSSCGTAWPNGMRPCASAWSS
jgi:hypothetical protein